MNNSYGQTVQKIRDKLTKTNPDGSVDASVIFFRNFIAGGTAGSIAVTTMAPMERVKLILQIQNYKQKTVAPETLYKGTTDCLIRLPKEQGVLSYWRGNLASVLRCFPYYALNFALKDKYKDYFVRGIDKKNHMLKRFAGNVLSGGIAGASAVTIIYPLDYARTRLAVDGGKTKATREYRGIWHCLAQTVQKDGIYGLYRGFAFSFFGVFLYRAIYFGLYDTGKDILSPHHHEHSLLIGFLNAEIASTTSGFMSYPFDTVRRTMMMQSGRDKDKRDYTSSWDCMKQLYKKRGFHGFYYGAWTNALRGTGGAIMLVIYDEIHHYLWPHHRKHYKEKLSTMMLPPTDDDFGDQFYNYDNLQITADDDYKTPIESSYTSGVSIFSSPTTTTTTISSTARYTFTCAKKPGLSVDDEEGEGGQMQQLDHDYSKCPARIIRERIYHICDF